MEESIYESRHSNNFHHPLNSLLRYNLEKFPRCSLDASRSGRPFPGGILLMAASTIRRCPVAPFCKPLVIPNAYLWRGLKSSVALENAVSQGIPRAEGSVDYTQKVILHAGDALFIPEGWNNFPRTLEAFILHLLSTVAAEVLARKFDEMDQHTTEEDRN